MSSDAYINPRMLLWARQRSGLSLGELGKKVAVAIDRMAAWEHEDSEDRPTFKQAQRLADALHVPFGYLFLDSPPAVELPLPDLRTKQHTIPLRPSPEFLEVVYDALRKQDWYRDYLQSQEAPFINFVAKYSLDSSVNEVADDIRNTLQLSHSLRRTASDNDDYFRILVRQCEKIGIAVLRSSVVGNDTHRSLDPEEFQGFAMSDPVAPLVFVNQNDYLSAQVFTLMHELAHLWTGATGVSDPRYARSPEVSDAVHQRFADRVAAEVLVPANEFSLRWDTGNSGSTTGERLEQLRRYYKVSVFVLLRRAYELEKLSVEEYRAEYQAQRLKIKPKRPGGGGGYSSLFSRNSNSVATAVIHSVASGALGASEGSVLLNVRPATLYRMEQALGAVAR